jgi:hypothetical protein
MRSRALGGTAYLAGLERERQAAAQQRRKIKLDARVVADGVAETVGLLQARGAAFEEPAAEKGGSPKAYRRLAGLDWLERKGRLSAAQKAAGERYGAFYRLARGEVSIASTLDISPGRAGQTPLSAVVARAEATVRARQTLSMLRERLSRQPALVRACDLICGEELTPREAVLSDRETYRLEAVLEVALDILATRAT